MSGHDLGEKVPKQNESVSLVPLGRKVLWCLCHLKTKAMSHLKQKAQCYSNSQVPLRERYFIQIKGISGLSGDLIFQLGK